MMTKDEEENMAYDLTKRDNVFPEGAIHLLRFPSPARRRKETSAYVFVLL